MRSTRQALETLDRLTPVWTITGSRTDRFYVVTVAGQTGPITVRGISLQWVLNQAVTALMNQQKDDVDGIAA
jgi:hypothetical protein